MSRIWNGKAFIDSMAARTWDQTTSFRAKLIEFVNEIQNELAGELPDNYFKFKLKKLANTQEEIIDINPQIPDAPSVAISQAPVTLDYNTTTESDYTKSVARDVEFQASNVVLGPGLTTDENFRARYAIDGEPDATAALTDVNGTLSGAATVSGGVLNLPTTNDSYAEYNGENTTWANEGCVRFKFKPNYSGSATSYLFAYADGENDIDNMVRILQSGNNIRWDVYNSTGTTIKTVQTSNTFVPVAGTTYEIEFNFDVAAGEYRLFIDGVNINGLQTSAAGTRTDDSGSIIRLGKNYTSGVAAGINGTVTDVQLFNTVQHTASYTPASIPLYSIDVPKITLNTGFSAGELDTFTESAVKPANTEIKYIFSVDGAEMWFTGGAWAASNGTFSESNTAAEIANNMEALLSVPGTIKINVFLQSTDDQETPELTSLTVTDIGQLVTGTEYKASITFLIFSEDGRNYMESELSDESAVVETDFDNQSITVSNIDTMDGSTSINPIKIWRRIYISKKESTDTEFSEPFYKCDVEDNTTTTAIISTEPTSTITPPSDSEVSQISEQSPRFNIGSRILTKQNLGKLRRYNSSPSVTSSTPSFFDFLGPHSIFISPSLSAGSTDDERTLLYEVYRRPHEIFYDKTRKIDLPIEAEPALRRGVEYLAYDFKDRDGKVTKMNQYEAEKKKFIMKMRRQKGRPSTVRDVEGDTFGYEV